MTRLDISVVHNSKHRGFIQLSDPNRERSRIFHTAEAMGLCFVVLFCLQVVYGRLIPHARRKDFAIVNYTNRDSAKKCIEQMNGSSFMGK